MSDFSPEVLQRHIEGLLGVPPRRIWLACSGGLDSTVLVHAVHRALPKAPLAVVHIDHRLHPHSSRWAEAVRRFAEGLALPCTVIPVTVAVGRGPEDAARQARYRAWEALLAPGEILFTAHHADDQAETVLLRILRGTGMDGLSGMPESRPLGQGELLRPLLPWSRRALRAYAEGAGLRWIDDPANADLGFDRNFLRHHILPMLETRFPAHRSLLRLAEHARRRSQGRILENRRRLAKAMTETGALRVAALGEEGDALDLLGAWFRHHRLPPPTLEQRRRLLREVAHARGDAQPRLALAGHEIRRHRGLLHLLPALSAPPSGPWQWSPGQILEIPRLGRLRGELSEEGGVLRGSGPFSVRLRTGGERIRLGGRTRTLKQCLQSAGLPPWQRDRLPLLFHGEVLAAIPGVGVADAFRTRPGESGWRLSWEGFHLSGEGPSGKV